MTEHKMCVLIFCTTFVRKISMCKKNSCRSQSLRRLRRRFAAARLLRLWVRIPTGAWTLSVVFCVLSGRELCDEPITRPEESY